MVDTGICENYVFDHIMHRWNNIFRYSVKNFGITEEECIRIDEESNEDKSRKNAKCQVQSPDQVNLLMWSTRIENDDTHISQSFISGRLRK